MYKCIVRDFTIAHRITTNAPPSKAFQLQEMGESGTGSLENGDASGEVFWMVLGGVYCLCFDIDIIMVYLNT